MSLPPLSDPLAPIDRLCALMDSLPANSYGKAAMLLFVCEMLGIPPEPTGLPDDPDRPIRQLYWDHDTQALRMRLIELSEGESIGPEFLVAGSLGVMRDRLAAAMAPEALMEWSRAHIELARNLKSLPMKQREPRLNDDELDAHIRAQERLIQQAPARGNDAKATSAVLERLAAELFSTQFWSDYNAADNRAK